MSENKTHRCGCSHESDIGTTICQGCGSAIVYGATVDEIDVGRTRGAATAGIVTSLILGVLPLVMNLKFQWNIPAAWGLGYFVIPIIIASAVWGGYKGVARVLEAKRGLIRSFPRR